MRVSLDESADKVLSLELSIRKIDMSILVDKTLSRFFQPQNNHYYIIQYL